MTIKYEPVFGDQSLFDAVDDDAIIVIRSGLSKRSYFFNESGFVKTGINQGVITPEAMNVAVRHIIKTPTWTRADKEAGVLPPVGAQCKDRSFSFKVINVTDKYVVIETVQSGDVYSLPHHSFVSSCEPIETPEEKEARLKREWCDSVNSKYGPRLSIIYDALLSGDLKAPTND